MARPPRIAFVGSGGAARGIAHLGVVKALEELNLRPSIFVGASAGALVSSMYGQGVPLDVLIDAYRAPWQRKYRGPYLHEDVFFGLPSLEQLKSPGYLLSGVFSIDKLERHLRNRLPTNDFRKTQSTILVTACDVDGRGREVFGKGHREDVPISQAVVRAAAFRGSFDRIKSAIGIFWTARWSGHYHSTWQSKQAPTWSLCPTSIDPWSPRPTDPLSRIAASATS